MPLEDALDATAVYNLCLNVFTESVVPMLRWRPSGIALNCVSIWQFVTALIGPALINSLSTSAGRYFYQINFGQLQRFFNYKEVVICHF